MNWQRYILAALAAFGFVFLFEWFVHGYLLMGLYQKTASVWREFSEMKAHMPLMILLQVILVAWLTYAFTQWYPNGGWENGLKFGLFFGLFAALLSAFWYIYLPVPSTLGWAWFLTSLIEILGAGLVIGSVYNQRA